MPARTASEDRARVVVREDCKDGLVPADAKIPVHCECLSPVDHQADGSANPANRMRNAARLTCTRDNGTAQAVFLQVAGHRVIPARPPPIMTVSKRIFLLLLQTTVPDKPSG